MQGDAGRDVLRGGQGHEGTDHTAELYPPVFVGGPGKDRLYGGTGNDELPTQGGCEPGSDRFYGGAGNDDLCFSRDRVPDVFHGGAGTDEIHYHWEEVRRGVVVSLDGVRNDGHGCPDACDNVDPSIENLDIDIPWTTVASDTIVGSDGPNVIRVYLEGEGETVVSGMGGDDRLLSGVFGNGRDSFSGGDGNDILRTFWGDDSLQGGPGDDGCHGGEGTDTALECEELSGVP